MKYLEKKETWNFVSINSINQANNTLIQYKDFINIQNILETKYS